MIVDAVARAAEGRPSGWKGVICGRLEYSHKSIHH
jgi:hypothetical protein